MIVIDHRAEFYREFGDDLDALMTALERIKEDIKVYNATNEAELYLDHEDKQKDALIAMRTDQKRDDFVRIFKRLPELLYTSTVRVQPYPKKYVLAQALIDGRVKDEDGTIHSNPRAWAEEVYKAAEAKRSGKRMSFNEYKVIAVKHEYGDVWEMLEKIEKSVEALEAKEAKQGALVEDGAVARAVVAAPIAPAPAAAFQAAPEQVDDDQGEDFQKAA
ncbi:hypothetical protein EKD04_014380 [Chloroflexales bacterium ZM16-3]|nr:hypothetical protein [Chloroflexales bacterium ZM16-3]